MAGWWNPTRGLGRHLCRRVGGAAGGLLILASAYVAYCGWYEIRVFRGEVTDDAIVDASGSVRSTAANWLISVGAGTVAVVLVTLLAGRGRSEERRVGKECR